MFNFSTILSFRPKGEIAQVIPLLSLLIFVDILVWFLPSVEMTKLCLNNFVRLLRSSQWLINTKKPLKFRGLILYFWVINNYLFSIFSKAFLTISFSFGNQPWTIKATPKTIKTILIPFFILRILVGVILDFNCLANTILRQSTSK